MITGSTGFKGAWLANWLLMLGAKVVGVGLKPEKDSIIFSSLELNKRINQYFVDIKNFNKINHIIKKEKPDIIFHLAAQSYVQFSFKSPAETLNINAIGTSNLLESVRISKINPKIHICSSSEVYGQVEKEEIPIKETNPFRPASPYAVSKVAEDMLGYQYFLSYNMHIVRTRMFTHTGPRRGDVFAESWFAKQIAMIESGIMSNPIKVGNLESIRTIMDVRDAVEAYWIMMEKSIPGEVYNIGGSKTLTIEEILNKLIEYSDKEIKYIVDKELLRPSDVTLQIPDTNKFFNLTNWQPKIKIEEGVKDLLKNINYWKSAPVWNPKTIKEATKIWFKLLSKKN